MNKLTSLLFIAFQFIYATAFCNNFPPVNTDSLIQEYCKEHKLIPRKSESGLYYVIKEKGNGAPVTDSGIVRLNYNLNLTDGIIIDGTTKKKFDHKYPFEYKVGRLVPKAGGVLPGFDEGMKLLNIGGDAIFIIPPTLGYGDLDLKVVPPNSVLIFDVKVLGIK